MEERATYYMVECDYPHETSQQRAAFDEFYWKHISMLLTIPGFLTAQRFQCERDVRAPFMALYRLSGPDVISSDKYKSMAGPTSVDPKFRPKMINWDRNIVQGPTGTSEPHLATPMGESLSLIDRHTLEAPPLPDGFLPLTVVGLDKTIAQRGVAVGSLYFDEIPSGWEVRHWLPIHPVRMPDQ